MDSQGGMGKFNLLISDKEADIEDFNYLNVTFKEARVFGENNDSFKTLEINSTVDLTHVVGEKAVSVIEVEMEEGNYSKLELHVLETKAQLKNGNSASVKIPSEKLMLTKGFRIKAGEETKFVFDIQVVKKGQKDDYNLRPVISKSGVVGKDIDEIEELD